MKRGVVMGLIVGAILILLVVGFLILNNNKGETSNPANSQNESSVNENQMVDCGLMDNPSCFMNRMSGCLPVTGKLTATDGSTEIELTILGLDFSNNTTCHFQRKVNNVTNLNCYFPKEAMSWNLIDQTFGNDHGLQSVVDESCKNI